MSGRHGGGLESGEGDDLALDAAWCRAVGINKADMTAGSDGSSGLR